MVKLSSKLRALFHHSGEPLPETLESKEAVFLRTYETLMMLKNYFQERGEPLPIPALDASIFNRQSLTEPLTIADRDALRAAMNEVIFLNSDKVPVLMNDAELESVTLDELTVIAARIYQNKPIYGEHTIQ